MMRAGAWACAAAKMVARNCRESGAGAREFAARVRMWVYEEEVDGRKLVRARAGTMHAASLPPCKPEGMWPPVKHEHHGSWLCCTRKGCCALPQTDIINERHENVRYLPGVPLGDNIVACPDLEVCCHGSAWPHRRRP